jgi:hypothetical protein
MQPGELNLNNLEQAYLTTWRETVMRQFLIGAAAMAAFTAVASAPASAIENYGPKQVGNQCFTPSMSHSRDLGFGNWGACPKPASTASAPAARRSAKR